MIGRTLIIVAAFLFSSTAFAGEQPSAFVPGETQLSPHEEVWGLSMKACLEKHHAELKCIVAVKSDGHLQPACPASTPKDRSQPVIDKCDEQAELDALWPSRWKQQ